MAVKVKQLEWVKTHGGKWLRAESVGLTYEVRSNDPRCDELKVRAQADYERRILSAIEEE